MMGYGWMAGSGWLWLLFCVAAIALVVWAVLALLAPRRPSVEDDALEILKRRYASGEINQAEYELARRTLGGAAKQ